MKKERFRKSAVKLIFILLLCGLITKKSLAWENKLTHPEITEKAVERSVLNDFLNNQLGLNDGLETQLELTGQFQNNINTRVAQEPEFEWDNKTKVSILEWLRRGSSLEDVPNPRARHHFHDPYRNTGLENKLEHPIRAVMINKATDVWYHLSFDLTGASTLKRALGKEEPEWEQEYENYFAWPDARDFFYKALTEESQATREHYMALTFLTLGHVLHLLEDMGVPAHVRNDFVEAHFRAPMGLWKNPLEEHVEDEVGSLEAIPERWLEGWTSQPKTFSKLAYYWDVSAYSGQYVGISPLSNWGLSEQTNYQFLSKSTIFRENVIIDPNTGERTKYYFPQPV